MTLLKKHYENIPSAIIQINMPGPAAHLLSVKAHLFGSVASTSGTTYAFGYGVTNSAARSARGLINKSTICRMGSLQLPVAVIMPALLIGGYFPDRLPRPTATNYKSRGLDFPIVHVIKFSPYLKDEKKHTISVTDVTITDKVSPMTRDINGGEKGGREKRTLERIRDGESIKRHKA